MRILPHISDAELELMLLLWKNRDSDGYQPVSTTEIMERLGNGWSVSTVFTLLSRLVKKGAAACRKEGRVNWYTALIREEDYRERETRRLLERLYAGSLKEMVASLCDEEVTPGELEELAALLEEKRRRL